MKSQVINCWGFIAKSSPLNILQSFDLFLLYEHWLVYLFFLFTVFPNEFLANVDKFVMRFSRETLRITHCSAVSYFLSRCFSYWRLIVSPTLVDTHRLSSQMQHFPFITAWAALKPPSGHRCFFIRRQTVYLRCDWTGAAASHGKSDQSCIGLPRWLFYLCGPCLISCPKTEIYHLFPAVVARLLILETKAGSWNKNFQSCKVDKQQEKESSRG